MERKIYQTLYSVISVERNINFLIEHQCPQCGGPATLKETDRLFTCEFCQVTSYLLEEGHFHYVLPHNAPDHEELFYFPYWRFKGMLFSVAASGINERFVDVSLQAIESRHFPATLGLRSQALKLQFVTPEKTGLFLDPVHSVDQLMEIIDLRFSKTLSKPILHKNHIGENISLIFAPFYLRERKLFDAVLNHPISVTPSDDFQLDQFQGHPARRHLNFLPTLCPQCGWDLWGQRDSLAMHCGNCTSVWFPRKGQLTKTNTAYLKADFPQIKYFPFWRINADVFGVPLSSYGDFIRLANIPKAVQSHWENTPFCFWGPAFKVRPQRYLQLTSGITVSQPLQELTPGTPQSDRLISANLPLEEAIETLKLNLANLIRPIQVMAANIQAIHIKPKRCLLVYIPFEERVHEFVQPDLTLAINKNQLALASNL